MSISRTFWQNKGAHHEHQQDFGSERIPLNSIMEGLKGSAAVMMGGGGGGRGGAFVLKGTHSKAG